MPKTSKSRRVKLNITSYDSSAPRGTFANPHGERPPGAIDTASITPSPAAIMLPTAHDMLLYAPPLIYLPTPADIDQYGRAEHLSGMPESTVLSEPRVTDFRATIDGGQPLPTADQIATMLDSGEIDRAGAQFYENLRGVANVPPAAASEAPAQPVTNDRAAARAAAAAAVAAFYNGVSMPFKSAADLRYRAPINFALSRSPSRRTAALLAAILTYCDVQPGTLTFVRGSGRVPGRLIGRTGREADELFAAGPESGGLSNCMPDRIAYISGETSGPGCENAVFRINYASARANLLAHNEKLASGEHTFSAALGLLDLLHKADNSGV